MAFSIAVTTNPTSGNPTLGVDPDAPAESAWTTPTTFDANLTALASGGTLWLAPGVYPPKRIDNRNFSAQTTIRSARLDNLAEFRHADPAAEVKCLGMKNTHNLRIKNLKLQVVGDSAGSGAGTMHWENCTYGTAEGIIADSESESSGVGWAGGANFNYCRNMTMDGCELRYGAGAIYLLYSRSITIQNSWLHHIRADFIGAQGCQDIFILNNVFECGWQTPTDPTDYHRDMIQWVGSGDPANYNTRWVVWRNKFLNSGGYWWAGVQMTDATASYTLVEENLFLTAHVEAIKGSGPHFYARRNTVLHDPTYVVGPFGNGGPGAEIRLYDSNFSVVSDNIALAIQDMRAITNSTKTNNRIISSSDYATWFNGPFPAGVPLTEAVMTAIPGNAIYTSGQGCQFTRPLDPVPAFPVLPWA